ncbi:hypothetical protein [Flavobacterium sp.]|uniref:hypothetical protein n=1 Tax=Flavobacterium sp. TaxID=239 RepID=UPI001B6E5EC0|nr:hypothetical protein [Flavobacterium sp.]MBP6183097.1 hypothetical protein [Flavobacterium sp.]
MKNPIITVVLVLISSLFSSQLVAQETVTKQKTKSNNTNEKSSSTNQVDCVVRIKSTDTGISIVFDNAIVSPRDAASGLPTGKRQHKPVRFNISPSDNTIVEVKSSSSDMVSSQSSVTKKSTTSAPEPLNSPGNPIKGISVKGGRNPGGNIGSFDKIVVTDGEFPLPADLVDGEYEMSISFTYQKIEYTNAEKVNPKSYVSGRFILDIDGGVCRSIKEKGVSVKSTR